MLVGAEFLAEAVITEHFAVVGDEEDDRVVSNSKVIQLGQDAANAVIDV